MKFSIKDFFSKYDQIPSFLWIWSHLLKKSLMENFIFFQWMIRDIFHATIIQVYILSLTLPGLEGLVGPRSQIF